ncbi:LysR family transcriptional regulator [Thalassospira profundimaris]|uniref:LysR family transcriptional regulator n=1 Tax=Thalassospira profundimaris TaxID=502049 RepID=UPI0002D33994|nr:LysR family transcriptional regulator [Thalassospira profundimaris]
MDNIDHFNLRSFDLNLMIAFDAMMQEMSVTKAAEKLRIGQSAMSHNLNTLRMLLADDLFVRVGQKMQPTAKPVRWPGRCAPPFRRHRTPFMRRILLIRKPPNVFSAWA